MKEVQEGEPFNLTTDKQKQGAELVIKNLKKGQTDKGTIIQKLNRNVYDQKKDCETLVKNLVASSNHLVSFDGRFDLVLGRENEVTVQ